ncbi:MAG: hypothetical protein HY335_02155 [Deinococcus sp.]|nr:hypothetical protein [Deinococcus sp.]
MLAREGVDMARRLGKGIVLRAPALGVAAEDRWIVRDLARELEVVAHATGVPILLVKAHLPRAGVWQRRSLGIGPHEALAYFMARQEVLRGRPRPLGESLLILWEHLLGLLAALYAVPGRLWAFLFRDIPALVYSLWHFLQDLSGALRILWTNTRDYVYGPTLYSAYGAGLRATRWSVNARYILLLVGGVTYLFLERPVMGASLLLNHATHWLSERIPRVYRVALAILAWSLSAPFILGFGFFLGNAALLLIAGENVAAEQVAIIAYYCLAIGVLIQLGQEIHFGSWFISTIARLAVLAGRSTVRGAQEVQELLRDVRARRETRRVDETPPMATEARTDRSSSEL